MWPYWMMFLVPAAAALMERARSDNKDTRPERPGIGWVAAMIGFTLVVGYRYKVGADWGAYLDQLLRVRGTTLGYVLSIPDPGYQLTNWLSLEAGGDVFTVNLVCGGLLAIGLGSLCQTLPRPWLALAVSVPYLMIVVGMGYSRQGVAVGMGMLGMAALKKHSPLRFMAWTIVGATFHKTAVLLLPITALAGTKNRYWSMVWGAAVTGVAYVLLLEDSVESLYAGYIEAEYQSEGALVRLLMNALPAGILLGMRKRFVLEEAEGALWRWIAIISIALLGILFVSPSSTAVDRVALYMIPLQLVVFSHLPTVLGGSERSNQGWTALVVLYYALVLFVWLNYAAHSRYWLPYRFYPLE